MENMTLQVEGIGKRFFSFELKDISFSLEPGYILGLTGRNGAGKTTLIKLLANPDYGKKGTIRICGTDARKNAYKAKQEIGLLMEEKPFFWQHTLTENAELLGGFYEKFSMEKFQSYLRKFDLQGGSYYSELSRGMKMKFQLAFALSYGPKLLLMDEATGGLDVVFRREFYYLLQEAVEQEMVSVIISTHVTEDLDKVADYVAFIENGRMKFYESKEELQESYRTYRKKQFGEAAGQGTAHLEDIIYHYDEITEERG